MKSRTVTVDDVIEMVKRLPSDKLAVAYDFIAFIQSRATAEGEQDDWLNDSEAAMATEDMLWTQAHTPSFVAESEAAYNPLRAAALAEIEAGETLPMFDEAGQFIADHPEA